MQKNSNTYTFGFAFAICIFCSVALAVTSTNLKPQQDLSARLDVVKNILSVAGVSNDKIAKIEKEDPSKLLELYNSKFESRIIDKNNQVVDLSLLKTELITKLNYKKSELDKKTAFEITKIFSKKISLLASASNMEAEQYDKKYKLIFLYKPNTEIEAYIVPVEGMGLWDMIYGYIAIEPDLNTVKDIRFYNQQETPGLGAECAKPIFTDRFKGKKILAADGSFQSIGVVKGKVENVISDEIKRIHYVDGISGGTITGDGITDFLKEDLATFNKYFDSIRNNVEDTKIKTVKPQILQKGKTSNE